ncbi:glycosyltransferase family 4 protein [Bacillus marinisedimentorum]|uniref:glycosyltransferase family 4 protein n=1 Tax=Bacillus marinisedimentorum TaxID=1821260 RepID=UPI0007E13329|nr:MraY family glycosyltransferase [Bacillus marinisedimentorum]
MTMHYTIAFIVSMLVAFFSTPMIKWIAIKIGATDTPNGRKVHTKIMPRLGGLSIVLGVLVGYLYLRPVLPYFTPIAIGATIIIIIGILDDKYTLPASIKFLAQLAAAIIVVASGLKVDFVTLPFNGKIELGVFGYIVAVLWIVGITNSINLIDGLDGLAGGVAAIATGSILVMALIDNQFAVVALSVILLGSTLGFLYFNFHPAKIFMGDTGALFLGYTISIISMLGLFKSVTAFSLIVPIIVLGVPIVDTFFAIIRRFLNRQKISAPDKSHLHHCLLGLGFSHRNTVLLIYSLSLFFGLSAILFSAATMWGSFLIVFLLLIVIQVTAEIVGLIGNRRKPLINTMKRIYYANSPRSKSK